MNLAVNRGVEGCAIMIIISAGGQCAIAGERRINSSQVYCITIKITHIDPKKILALLFPGNFNFNEDIYLRFLLNM